jgi:multidrug efflux pump subunit AcrA (membrane-fusion protein)
MTVQSRESATAHVLPFRSPRPPARLQRRLVWPAAVVAVVLFGIVAVVATSSARSTPSAVATPRPVIAPIRITMRGLIQPTRNARVGTLTGGVVRRLDVALGADVVEQSIVAWVAGPTGTEVVTAPFAGSVTNVLAHEGDTVLPGSVIAIVADIRSLQVETADVDEYIVSQVHVGLPVEVIIDAFDSTTLNGTVTGVALQPQASASGNRTYPVIINVVAMPTDVRAGMSVRVLVPER